MVGACIAAGVREFVVCAGARNLDLVSALSEYHKSGEVGPVQVYSHFEERAAGFFALGRTMETSSPCAVITTSGTAVAELLPSVIEARYQKRPLVIVSADRPSRYRGSGAPQVIDQVDLFGENVEKCEDVTWKDELLLFDGWSGESPWHLNVCLEENEVLPGGGSKLSKVRVGRLQRELPKLNMLPVLEMFKDAWKGMVVMLGGLDPDDREEVWLFLRDLGAPVLADTTSGLREALGKLALVDGDRILRESPPAMILRIGEVPIGRFWRDLEELQDVKVVSLTRTDFSGLARECDVITGDIPRSLRALGEVPKVGDPQDYLKRGKRALCRVVDQLNAYPESEPGMIRTLSVMATVGQSLYLGNSLPVREWNDYAQRDIPYEKVWANRGANGIDGQIATWLGATADESDAWGVFGDLTTLYDLSAPSLMSQVECRGRMLVVINNSGGQIFSRLPKVQEMDQKVAQLISNQHELGFESWAKMWGMKYIRVTGIEDFDFEPSEVATVVEVVPDSRQTELFINSMK